MGNVYMKVSKDELRLPEAVAESTVELAKICGVSVNAVNSAISKAKQRNQNSIYVKVEVEEDDEDYEWWSD